jgi:large conductance mechanosensitive channel
VLKEFREFALKGNMLDMAVGIVIGAAFGTIIKSLVDDVLMPPLGLLLGGVDFTEKFVVLREGAASGPYATLEAARAAGATTVNWGLFVNALVAFLIIALVLFFVIRGFNRMQEARKREEEQAPPAEPPVEQKLLTEIRDLLKARG